MQETIKKWTSSLALVVAVATLSACGGGGGGGGGGGDVDGDEAASNGGTPSTSAATNAATDADNYLGVWRTDCLSIPEAVPRVTGAVLSEKLTYTFTNLSTNVMGYTFEVELYSTPDCTGNSMFGTQTSTGEWTIDGVGDLPNTDKVSNRPLTSPGIIAGVTLVLNDVALPGNYLVRRPPPKDLFQVTGATLITGNLTPTDAQGYPSSMNLAAIFRR